MVVRLTLAYRGTAYGGWQRQANAPTVQAAVEAALADLLGEATRVVGASRTDAGVHARGQAAHLVLARDLPCRALVHGGNRRLPGDIRVLAADRMAAGFHARYAAAAKEYRYHLVEADVLSPLDALFAWRVAPGIDRAAMARAVAALPGMHDFSAFALAGGSHRRPERRLLEAGWEEGGERFTFRVVGEGFLRGMVRSLVGTLVEVGRGRLAPEAFAALLGGGERHEAGPTAPPQGLVLERVIYPERWRPLGEDPVAPAAPGGGASPAGRGGPAQSME